MEACNVNKLKRTGIAARSTTGRPQSVRASWKRRTVSMEASKTLSPASGSGRRIVTAAAARLSEGFLLLRGSAVPGLLDGSRVDALERRQGAQELRVDKRHHRCDNGMQTRRLGSWGDSLSSSMPSACCQRHFHCVQHSFLRVIDVFVCVAVLLLLLAVQLLCTNLVQIKSTLIFSHARFKKKEDFMVANRL